MRKLIVIFLFLIFFASGCGKEKYSFPWNFEDYSSQEMLNSSANIYTGMYNGTQYSIAEYKVNGIYRYEIVDPEGNQVTGDKKEKIIEDYNGYLEHWVKQNTSYTL